MKNILITIICVLLVSFLAVLVLNKRSAGLSKIQIETKKEDPEMIRIQKHIKELDKISDKWKEGRAKQVELINQFLDRQMRGGAAADMFCDQGSAVSFFAVRSWTFVDSPESPNTGFVNVRIDSSNKGGLQITALYQFWINDPAMGEKPDRYCIRSIDEK